MIVVTFLAAGTAGAVQWLTPPRAWREHLERMKELEERFGRRFVGGDWPELEGEVARVRGWFSDGYVDVAWERADARLEWALRSLQRATGRRTYGIRRTGVGLDAMEAVQVWLHVMRDIGISPMTTPEQRRRLVDALVRLDRDLLRCADHFACEYYMTWVDGFGADIDKAAVGAATAAHWREVEAVLAGESLPWHDANRFYQASGLATTYLPAGSVAADRDMTWRCHRACLRLVIAGVLARLGCGPTDPDWPVDPFRFAPIERVRVDGRLTVRIDWPEFAWGREACVESPMFDAVTVEP